MRGSPTSKPINLYRVIALFFISYLVLIAFYSACYYLKTSVDAGDMGQPYKSSIDSFLMIALDILNPVIDVLLAILSAVYFDSKIE